MCKLSWLCGYKDSRFVKGEKRLDTFTTDAPSQLDVLRHDCDPFCVDSTQVGVFEQSNKIGLRGFLQSHHSRALETQVSFEVLSDLPNQALERQLADQQLGRLLVSSDFSKGDGTRAVSMRLLDSASGWGTLSGSLGGELLAWGFSSGRLASGLLGSGHFEK